VADAFGADVESFPDGLGAGGFAGVIGEAQAGGLGAGVEVAERLGTGAALVAAETRCSGQNATTRLVFPTPCGSDIEPRII